MSARRDGGAARRRAAVIGRVVEVVKQGRPYEESLGIAYVVDKGRVLRRQIEGRSPAWEKYARSASAQGSRVHSPLNDMDPLSTTKGARE